jgi:capsid protein
MAFMVYGLEYRLDSNRGIPLITVVMEKLKKMERYSEATLGSAEERQKIAYSIEHEAYSTGQNPLDQQLAKAFNINPAKDDVPVDIDGRVLARNITATTNKQAINMPLGAKLNVLESKNELHFKDFYTVNIDLVCAALGIPPNVAMSKYDANFSASRAALKDWEYTLIVDRNQFDRQFYKTCFNFWFYVNVLNNKIQAPGYIQAFNTNNRMVTEAYTRSRWVGANVPHIDPLKEVNAERAKLGDTGASIPLTTVEAATEALNGGDSKANLNQYSKELKTSKDLGVTGPVNP